MSALAFTAFTLPDKRTAYVRSESVVAVWDSPDYDNQAIVHTNGCALIIPYTAEEALNLLYGTPQ